MSNEQLRALAQAANGLSRHFTSQHRDFIAAASPDVVLALLDEITTLKNRIQDLCAGEEYCRAYIEACNVDQRDVLADNQRLREALEKLARLGNGEHYGNSIGNQIAIAALKEAT